MDEIANEEQLRQAIAQLETQMREAAKKFEFERAAALRDRIRALKQRDLGVVLGTPQLVAEQPSGPAESPSAPSAGATSPPSPRTKRRS